MSKGGESVDAKQHKERLDQLREKTHRKVDYHLQKAYLEPDDFYHLITEFFLDLLEKDYEATYEEILDELERIEHEYLLFSKSQRERAAKLLTDLSELHYRHQKISQEQARTVLEEFRDLAEEFTRFEEESVQRLLREATKAMRSGDKKAAMAAYQKAHDLYTRLGEDEQQVHFPDMQAVYGKLQEA